MEIQSGIFKRELGCCALAILCEQASLSGMEGGGCLVKQTEPIMKKWAWSIEHWDMPRLLVGIMLWEINLKLESLTSMLIAFQLFFKSNWVSLERETPFLAVNPANTAWGQDWVPWCVISMALQARFCFQLPLCSHATFRHKTSLSGSSGSSPLPPSVRTDRNQAKKALHLAG